MDQRELGILATTYIAAQKIGESVNEHHPLWWAIERFLELEQNDPENCWLAILEVLSLDPPQKVLGALSAGPLEELIELYGEEFIDRIEETARRDSKFRKLLCGVWQSGSDEVWNRIVEIRADQM
jgi:Family of unknown function (DUF6869)